MEKGVIKIVKYSIVCLLVGLLASCTPPGKAKPEKAAEAKPAAPAETQLSYIKDVLVEGSDFHGVHGMGFDSDNNLYAGSVHGQSLYKVDTKLGRVETFVGPVEGLADDIEFSADGTMVWTSYLHGIVRSRDKAGNMKELAKGLMGINSLAFKQDGRLFATQVFLADALWEIDMTGNKPPRKILEKMGGLNGFDFGPDGMLYGPLWFKGQIARVNVDTGTLTVVADGFKIPAAANFDSEGNLWVVDTAMGHVVKVDVNTGEKQVVAKVATSIDNLAIDSNDNLYISNMANNGIYQIDRWTGSSRTVVEGKLAAPGGIAVVSSGGTDTLYVADTFAFRSVDGNTGDVTDIERMHGAGTKIEYPLSASANEEVVMLASWFTSSLHILDRKTGKTLDMIHKLNAPHDALALPGGGYLVAETGTGKLLKVSGKHGKNRSAVIEKLAGPMGLAWAGKDAVYVTEVFGGMISRVDINTGQKTVVISGLKFPEDIAVDPDGDIIVAEVGKRRLIAVDPKTGAIGVVASRLPIGLPGYPGLLPTHAQTGVAVSSDGSIYMSSDLQNAIYKFTPMN